MGAKPSFDDLEVVESPTTDDDGIPVVKLDPGEEIVATLRHIEREVGQHKNSMLHLTDDGDPVKMWSNGTIDRKLADAGVSPGDIVGIRKAAEQYEYTTDDGETGEAYDFTVAVQSQ